MIKHGVWNFAQRPSSFEASGLHIVINTSTEQRGLVAAVLPAFCVRCYALVGWLAGTPRAASAALRSFIGYKAAAYNTY
jgi:hypothetical protein